MVSTAFHFLTTLASSACICHLIYVVVLRVADYYVTTGAYCCFHQGILMHHRTSQCRYISITLIRKALQKDGMHVPNSLSSCIIQKTPPTLSSVVSGFEETSLCSTQRNNTMESFLDAHHRFTADECDWGFTRFHDLRKLFQSPDGHKRPVIEDDTTSITVYVRVLKDPTGVLWHNFLQ